MPAATRTNQTELAPIRLATYTLAGADQPTIRDLLDRLHASAPERMGEQGFRDVVFRVESDRQWVTLTFRDALRREWSLGLQFVRTPEELGPRVEAYIRLIDGPKRTEFYKLQSKIEEALRSAG